MGVHAPSRDRSFTIAPRNFSAQPESNEPRMNKTVPALIPERKRFRQVE
jgi:hypothetical protein